jgi:hypothetical protein
VPFIRYTRDKRGFENTLVMHAYREPDGSQRAKVLYLFRSPGTVRIGRQPLDEEVVEALEHTHPDLAFDWEALLRQQTEPQLVGPRRRRRTGRSKSAGSAEARDATPEAKVEIADESVLGRALGAAEAADLRRRYRELLDRILRRARTPEDRDRLTERAQRLNPDDWADEATVRESLPSAEAEWTEIAAELPRRRRGRRGGRRRTSRDGGDGAAGAETAVEAESGPADGAAEPEGSSGIMAGEGHSDAVEGDEHVAGPGGAAGTPGERRSLGPEPDGEPEPPAADVPLDD